MKLFLVVILLGLSSCQEQEQASAATEGEARAEASFAEQQEIMQLILDSPALDTSYREDMLPPGKGPLLIWDTGGEVVLGLSKFGLPVRHLLHPQTGEISLRVGAFLIGGSGARVTVEVHPHNYEVTFRLARTDRWEIVSSKPVHY